MAETRQPAGDRGAEAGRPPPAIGAPAGAGTGEGAARSEAAPAPAGAAGGASPPVPPFRRGGRLPLDREVHDRLTLFVVRALFFLIAGGIGFYCTRLWPLVLDTYITILVSCGVAVVVILAEVFFSKAPIRTISAIAFGLIMGLIMSAVFQPVVELMVQSLIGKETDPKILQFLRLVTTTLFCYYGVTVLLQTKDDFKFIIPYVEFRKEVKGRAALVVDTSAIIDGRIQSLLSTGVLDQRIIVPKFVFDELQAVADSADRGRRERGRRGLDILGQLCREHGAEVVERAVPPGTDVDAALLSMVTGAGGKIVTTDYNLQKRAAAQGISVINLNDLAAALKPALVPGEEVRVKLLRPGEDQGQAVGFLADGTMVVVESASRRIGQEVTAEVTSAIQTSAGKMVFGRLRGGGGRNGERFRGRPGGARPLGAGRGPDENGRPPRGGRPDGNGPRYPDGGGGQPLHGGPPAPPR